MILCASLFALGLFSGYGQSATAVRRQASVSIRIKGSKPTAAESAALLNAAKAEIIAAHIKEAPQSRQNLLVPLEATLQSNADRILSAVQVVAEQTDRKAKTQTISIVADVNETAIDQFITPAGPAAGQSDGPKHYITLVFVSRRQARVMELGPEVIQSESAVNSATDSASQSSGGGTASTTVTARKDATSITKSAVAKNSHKISYEASTSGELDAAISAVLADRNFKLVDPATIRTRSKGAFAVEKFVEQFKAGNDIEPQVVEDASTACQQLKLPFYGFGSLTLEPPQTDPVSGRTRVNVQIYAKVIDCRDAFPTTLASVEATQYSALGSSQTEAETAALNGAAKTVARLLADKFNAKGVR